MGEMEDFEGRQGEERSRGSWPACVCRGKAASSQGGQLGGQTQQYPGRAELHRYQQDGTPELLSQLPLSSEAGDAAVPRC